MDYKYIAQLTERYWRGETSVEEESILRAFFSQKDVPAELIDYRPLFTYIAEEKERDVLGDDFDRRILARTEEARTVKARTISLAQRLAPLMKAAAVVAAVLILGASADFILDLKNATPQVAAGTDEDVSAFGDDAVAQQSDTIVIDTTRAVSQTRTPITTE